VAQTLYLPGFVNAHSHAFQRALRGRTEGDDFWGWRDAMLELAESLTVEQVRVGYEQVYREMLNAGYTAVGEFHYLGLPEAREFYGRCNILANDDGAVLARIVEVVRPMETTVA